MLFYVRLGFFSLHNIIVKPESSDKLKSLLQSISKYAKESDNQLISIITDGESSITSTTILQGNDNLYLY